MRRKYLDVSFGNKDISLLFIHQRLFIVNPFSEEILPITINNLRDTLFDLELNSTVFYALQQVRLRKYDQTT